MLISRHFNLKRGFCLRPGFCLKPGFSLLELLVVLAIIGILAALSVPPFAQQLASHQNKNVARKLLSAVMLARGMAQLEATEFLMCPWSNETAQCEGDYRDGFAVVNTEGRLVRFFDVPPNARITNRRGTSQMSASIEWDRFGMGSYNATLSVCHDQRGADNWAVVLNRLGRPRMLKNWGQCDN